MARIAGVNIPTKKTCAYSTNLYIWNWIDFFKKICEEANLISERRVADLSDEEVTRIREIIDRDYIVEGDLRRQSSMDIKRYMDLGCLRGLRHRKGLPVRGQRTHTNARTRKGKPKAIAGKKK